MGGCRDPDSLLTLAEGLAEYYAAYPRRKREADLAPSARTFFRSHDAVHAAFGCDTSPAHEAIVKLSSLFGTTGGAAVMRGYGLYDALDIYRALPLGEVLRTLAAAPVIVPRTILRCLGQEARRPWDDLEPLLDMPFTDIRERFGIVVASGGPRRDASRSIR